MKIKITLLAIFLSMGLFAQKTIEKDLGNFHTLKVFDLMEVNLIQSDENKVVIKGKDTHYVKIINQNGKLKLRMELDNRFDGAQTFIEVYFTNIKLIDANEGAVIVANELIEQDRIELRSQEGGKIKVGLKVDDVKVKAVTGGIVQASGLAKYQEIKLNTGGIFEGRELETQTTKIAITAAGEAEVNAEDLVDASITAGGDIYIYGDPKEINRKQLAGGRIKIMQ
jgi:hypothetical protein